MASVPTPDQAIDIVTEVIMEHTKKVWTERHKLPFPPFTPDAIIFMRTEAGLILGALDKAGLLIEDF